MFLLAAVMFVQHAIMACWSPIMPIALQDWGFSVGEIANVFGILSIASILAPWIGGQLADRVIPAQHLVIGSNLIGGAMLWICSTQRSFLPVALLLLAQGILYMPVFALMNHVVMSHLSSGAKNFGYIRMFGTAGWVLGSLGMSLWLSRPAWLPAAASASLDDGLRGAALLSLLAAALALWLPHTPPSAVGGPRFAALAVLRMLRSRDIAVLMAISFVFSLASPFAFPGGGLFLRSLGVSDSQMPLFLSLGQMVEVLAFGLTAAAVHRFGFKWTFVIGMAAWALRFAVWSGGGPMWLVIASLGLHGVCYAWVIGLGQMYVDHHSNRDTRASAQALHLVVTVGLGVWPANALMAMLTGIYTSVQSDGTTAVDYAGVFFWPGLVSILATIAFAALFREAPPLRREPIRTE